MTVTKEAPVSRRTRVLTSLLYVLSVVTAICVAQDNPSYCIYLLKSADSGHCRGNDSNCLLCGTGGDPGCGGRKQIDYEQISNPLYETTAPGKGHKAGPGSTYQFCRWETPCILDDPVLFTDCVYLGSGLGSACSGNAPGNCYRCKAGPSGQSIWIYVIDLVECQDGS